MSAHIAESGVDLGIVVSDLDAALAFYRDALGLTVAGDNPLPGGGVMYRLHCGASILKLCKPPAPPSSRPVPGNLWSTTGFRYFTITVANLDETMAEMAAAGYPAVVAPMAIGDSGARIAMVADPDGNRVEFLEHPA
jgi:catechol 2,3-dioxygenase-like lactoylglutathione lyase family enzyme